MSALRHPAAQGRRDANHRELEQLYQALGCSTADTHIVGVGFPDMVIGIMGITDLVEIKIKDGELSPGQEHFASTWRGRAVRVVFSADDVVKHVNELRREAARSEKCVS